MKQNEIKLIIYPFENQPKTGEAIIAGESFSIELATELTRYRQFSVMEPTLNATSFTYEPDPVEEPTAQYYVKGIIRPSGDQLVINARLINAASNELVWGERFETGTAGIATLQEELLQTIVSSLQEQLDFDLLDKMRKKPLEELNAYECYLNGMKELRKGSLNDDLAARKFFQQAIALQPDYSLAHSGMSLSYFNEWSCQLWERWDVSKNGAHDWAMKAIELDEKNHVAALVLGRTFLYKAEYDTAEHYLRKALRLNPNDVDSLVQVAICFVYLGYLKQAEKLFLKAISINPLCEMRLFYMGAYIYFEAGDYEKAIAYASKSQNSPWVDFKAYIAAAHYYLGDHEKMQEQWNGYLADFKKAISDQQEDLTAAASKWLLDINPFKYESKVKAFLDFINEEQPLKLSLSNLEKAGTRQHAIFLKDEIGWQCRYEDITIHINGSKGFYDIATLLGRPNEPMHCSKLMGSVMEENGEPLIDEKAKQQYKNRIIQLQDLLQEAETSNDTARTNNLRNEYDALLDHLSSALGIKGKVRTAGKTAEKARTAVTWRIRKAIKQLEQAHPALAKHFSVSIKTGTYCSYEPEKEISWSL